MGSFTSASKRFAGLFAVSFCFSVATLCQQAAAPASNPANPPSFPERVFTPKLKHRPPPKPQSKVPEGNIHLDVVVTDALGKPVADLQQQDFTLLDNNLPRKIVSFQSIDGPRPDPEPPVEIILVIDKLNATFQQVASMRSEVAKFLRKNNGHLAQPVTLALLTDTGLKIQSRPSVDGSAQLAMLKQVRAGAANVDTRLGGLSIFERFLLSVQQLSKIAQIETRKPGRKLLIWMGPGWPVDQPDFTFPGRDRQLLFDTIVEISNRLRQARVVVNSVSSDSPITNASGFNQIADLGAMATTVHYASFLKEVRTAQQIRPGNLYLQVFAAHTGGRILGPNNDLVAQIEQCIRDAGVYYHISFDAPPPAQPDEFHELKIQMNRPELTAHTTTGYYNEPPWK